MRRLRPEVHGAADARADAIHVGFNARHLGWSRCSLTATIMPLAGARGPTPPFPSALLRHELRPYPPIERSSSLLCRRIDFYIHEWLLKPLSRWYCRFRDIPMQAGTYPLPFNLILKNNPRLREQEGLATNLARAMSVPAPRFISFAEPPPGYMFSDGIEHALPPLLMTRVPGIELDELKDDEVDFDVIKSDLRIVTLMRSFSSSWGDAICGADGGPVAGPLVPLSPLQACSDEAAFYNLIREIGNFAGRNKDVVAPAEKFFSLPPHAVVFTHGDLNRHNIMVGPDGHITGTIDWEAAAWLPDYWEVSAMAVLPQRHWGRFMNETVTGGVYAEEVLGHRHMFCLVTDSLRY